MGKNFIMSGCKICGFSPFKQVLNSIIHAILLKKIKVHLTVSYFFLEKNEFTSLVYLCSISTYSNLYILKDKV